MTQPAPVPSAPPTPTAAPLARRGGWASDYVARLVPEANRPAVPPTTAPTISHGRAFARGLGDASTVGITSGLLGAAHARGMLDQGRAALDGLLALFGIGLGIVAAPYAPRFSRFTTNLGLAGTASLMFRKGYELAGGEPLSPTSPPAARASRVSVDPIAAAAEELGV